MEDLQLCGIANCGKPATCICLKNTVKERRCHDHSFPLLDKGYTVVGIDGDDFISTASDVQEYRERKALADKGRGNLTALEIVCDQEYQAALALIEAEKDKILRIVQARFEEMKLAARKRHQDVKQQMDELKVNLTKYLCSKGAVLSSGAQLVCSDLTVQPKLLRIAVADVSEDITQVLLKGWTASAVDAQNSIKCLDATQRSSMVVNLLEEAAEQAKKGVLEALQVVDSWIGELYSYPAKSEIILAEMLKFEAMRLESSIEWLQRAWDLRQRYQAADSGTIAVGLRLASFYCLQSGKYFEAEKILRLCYSVAHQLDPLSEDSMALCNEIGGVYLFSGRYYLAETCCQWVLDTFATADLPAAQYWTTVLFLTISMQLQSKRQEANAFLGAWRDRELRQETKFGEMLRQLTCGIGALYEGDQTEARKRIFQARRIGTSHFPTSLFTALALSFSALLSEESAREQYHYQARSIYEVVAPKSTLAAKNLSDFGLHFKDRKQWNEAEACYRRAQSIYETADPNSILAAVNFNNMGNLYSAMERLGKAEWHYRQAHSILKSTAPTSIFAAVNLNDIGNLYSGMKRWGDAEWHYQQAKSILETVDPLSDLAAANLISLSDVLKEKERWSDADECYRKAEVILEGVGPKSIEAAMKWNALGQFYTKASRWGEAERCLQRARSTLEAFGPESVNAIENLHIVECALEEYIKRMQSAGNSNKEHTLRIKTSMLSRSNTSRPIESATSGKCVIS